MITCQKCLVPVDPRFVSAIRDNKCPACSGEIMSEESKNLYSELSEMMKKMPNDPDGLAGWLLSNYYLEKIDPEKEVEPAKFYYPKEGKKQRPKNQKLTKQQQLYNQDFDPEVDLDEEPENDFSYSQNKIMQQAGINRTSAETQALLQKAKQNQNEQWDPVLLNAIAALKPEAMDYNDSETDFSTYEDSDYMPNNKAPKSPQDVLKENLMRQNKSRSALSGSDPRGFRRSR